MELLSAVTIVLVFTGDIVISQYIESPCPDIFQYNSDNYGVYGEIHLKSNGPVSSVELRANFTIAARLPTTYVGRVDPVGGTHRALQDYNNGLPIVYKVQFPVTSPLPRLTAVVVNNNIICYGPGDIPGPNQYVTTTSLMHTLFLKGHEGFHAPNTVYDQYDRPRPAKPDQVLDYFGQQFGNDGQTQIFTFGDDDGTGTGSWNSINFRPDVDKRHEQTTQSNADRHEQYYPEPATQAPRPPPPPPQWPTPPPPPPQRPAPPSQSPPQQTFQTPAPQPAQVIPTETVQCGRVSGSNERLPLIYNGQTYSRGDWPWLVAIYKKKFGSLTFICSGTLVSHRHVVTAAHCMRQKNSFTSNTDIVVKVGVYNLEDWSDDVTVTRKLESATIHESYNASSLANDILILKFDKSVEFTSNIRPACLWSGNPDLSLIVGASGVVAGWGQSETSVAGKGEPRVVRMPVVSTSICRASRPDFHKLTSANTLCAGDRNGSGPCLGDSGGGLYLLEGGRWQIRGVVSLSLRPDNGDNTCNLNEYIVFTDSAQYLPWIKRVIANG